MMMESTQQANASVLLPSDAKQAAGSLAALLTAAAGMVGSAASGIRMEMLNADSLLQMAALAAPQLVAWLISYVFYSHIARSHTEGVSLALMPASPDATIFATNSEEE